jgi:hypothetical protein
MCSGPGGCGDLVALVVLAVIAFTVALAAVGFWIRSRVVKRAGHRRPPPLDEQQEVLRPPDR